MSVDTINYEKKVRDFLEFTYVNILFLHCGVEAVSWMYETYDENVSKRKLVTVRYNFIDSKVKSSSSYLDWSDRMIPEMVSLEVISRIEDILKTSKDSPIYEGVVS